MPQAGIGSGCLVQNSGAVNGKSNFAPAGAETRSTPASFEKTLPGAPGLQRNKVRFAAISVWRSGVASVGMDRLIPDHGFI